MGIKFYVVCFFSSIILLTNCSSFYQEKEHVNKIVIELNPNKSTDTTEVYKKIEITDRGKINRFISMFNDNKECTGPVKYWINYRISFYLNKGSDYEIVGNGNFFRKDQVNYEITNKEWEALVKNNFETL
jgi:hypothetical protein